MYFDSTFWQKIKFNASNVRNPKKDYFNIINKMNNVTTCDNVKIISNMLQDLGLNIL